MRQGDWGLATGGWRTEVRGLDRAPGQKFFPPAKARIDRDGLTQSFGVLPPASSPQPPVGGALQ